MKAAFYTLGCKVNQYETQLMTESLRKSGFEIVPSSEMADVYVVNSCTVTAASNQKTRQSLRSFKRKNPNSIVVLAGCMSQAYPDEAKELSEADIIIGNTEHKKLPELIEKKLKEQQRYIEICPHETGEAFENGIIHSFDSKTRAIVKIEDGCNRFCSYCAIPYARGRVRSKPLEVIKQEVCELAKAGYKEIVLVGINLSAYNTEGKDMADAVKIAAQTEGIERVRLGSLEPDHITNKIIDKLKDVDKFCPQFHISLQSGCDKTLKNMNRHYTAAEYKALCDKLRSTFNECTITTDIMVGFPGESDEDFDESLHFAEKIGFEKMHVFPYSVREGTQAAKMKNQLTKKVKTERAKKMLALADKLRKSFFKAQTGKKYEVLFETKKGDYNLGYTRNYIPVKVQNDENLQDEILEVEIIGCDDENCIGKIS